jgi:hypothetical protein
LFCCRCSQRRKGKPETKNDFQLFVDKWHKLIWAAVNKDVRNDFKLNNLKVTSLVRTVISNRHGQVAISDSLKEPPQFDVIDFIRKNDRLIAFELSNWVNSSECRENQAAKHRMCEHVKLNMFTVGEHGEDDVGEAFHLSSSASISSSSNPSSPARRPSTGMNTDDAYDTTFSTESPYQQQQQQFTFQQPQPQITQVSMDEQTR